MTPARHNPDPILTVNAAAEWSGFSPQTIRRRVADGSIRSKRFGARAIRIRLSDLEAWLNAGDPE